MQRFTQRYCCVQLNSKFTKLSTIINYLSPPFRNWQQVDFLLRWLQVRLPLHVGKPYAAIPVMASRPFRLCDTIVEVNQHITYLLFHGSLNRFILGCCLF